MLGQVSKAGIAGLIPHTGAMCLLDAVLEWDQTKIRCCSRSHNDPDNPLRSGGSLTALCAIEYAAQAMAVHGGLAGNVASRPKAGYLASLRDVKCSRWRLADLTDELIVDAEQIMGDETRVVYRFIVKVGDVEVVSGRATVVLDVTAVGRRDAA
jgi:predicted hotdog family 3-hydroxylacyl-ACP dehydratase